MFTFISVNCFSQEEKKEVYNDKKDLIKFENFEIENNVIVWRKVFEIDSIDVIATFHENLKLKFNKDNSGTVSNLSLNCKGTSIQLGANFNLDFRIDLKDGKYRVTATNFIFESPMQFSSGMVSTSRMNYNLEYFLLKKNFTLRKNFQVKADLECMNKVLTDLFTIKSILPNNDKW
jgi:hypothetical protein